MVVKEPVIIESTLEGQIAIGLMITYSKSAVEESWPRDTVLHP